MLTELQIRNLGVIEEATAEFAEGFTVLTGETGAGKTMVVTGLKLLSGARADAQRVRSGADKATVDGIFQLNAGVENGGVASREADEVRHIVEDVGGYLDEGEVVISRSVNSSGRSRAHLAGRTVAAGVLTDVSSRILTIHGQSDQLQLTDPVRQLRGLDKFAGLDADRLAYRKLRRQWLHLSKELQERTVRRRELSLEAETLRHALAQIDGIDPQPGEDEQLKIRIRNLQDADDVRTAVVRALAFIDGDDATSESGAAEDLLVSAADTLLSAPGDDSQLKELGGRLSVLSRELTDISGELGSLLAQSADLEDVENLLHRQQELRELRSFAVDVDGVRAWREEARRRLDSIDVSDDALEQLRGQVDGAAEEMVAAARKLAVDREAASSRFSEAVTAEIRGLQMSAQFRVMIRPHGSEGKVPARKGPTGWTDFPVTAADCGPDGITEVEFQLVQGGGAQPLGSTASGGELSRVMLALEVILAGGGRTMVFDEVDSGVGGRAAVEIGRRLARLAIHNQVIVVTHLPQVAAFADIHLHVSKGVAIIPSGDPVEGADSSGSGELPVTSSVRTLTENDRVEELSRMLAGLDSDSGRAHAEELLSMAREVKATLNPSVR